MILENTIQQASQLLKNHNVISHELDAEIILSDIMGVTKEFLSGDAFEAIAQDLRKQDQEIKLENLKQ